MIRMIKRQRSIGFTVLLLIAITFVSLNMITGDLYAIECRIGPCNCECVDSDCILDMMPANPYDMGGNYFVGCSCSDKSEHCVGMI